MPNPTDEQFAVFGPSTDGDPVSLEKALAQLEIDPLAVLLFWNGESWVEIFWGLEEFSGVKSESMQ